MLALLLCKPANLEQNYSISHIYISLYRKCMYTQGAFNSYKTSMYSIEVYYAVLIVCLMQCSHMSYTWCSGFMQAKLQACLFVFLFAPWLFFISIGHDECQDSGLEWWHCITQESLNSGAGAEVLSKVDPSACLVERASILQRSHVDTATLCGYELQH